MRQHDIDVRRAWRRWIAPNQKREGRVALSVVWFTIGLSGLLAATVTYGWRSAPIDHQWHSVAYLSFFSWAFASRWLHRW